MLGLLSSYLSHFEANSTDCWISKSFVSLLIVSTQKRMNTARTSNLHNTSIPVKENKIQSFPCCSTITICLSRFLSQTRTCFRFTNKIKSPISRFYEERKCARRVICFLFSFWTSISSQRIQLLENKLDSSATSDQQRCFPWRCLCCGCF